MTSKINNNIRKVTIPCFGCGHMLKFSIENDIVVMGDGRIVCNIPGAVCEDCIKSVLDKVADPPGLICINRLSPVLARELLTSFTFLLPKSEAVEFFALLFPEIGLEANMEDKIL